MCKCERMPGESTSLIDSESCSIAILHCHRADAWASLLPRASSLPPRQSATAISAWVCLPARATERSTRQPKQVLKLVLFSSFHSSLPSTSINSHSISQLHQLSHQATISSTAKPASHQEPSLSPCFPLSALLPWPPWPRPASQPSLFGELASHPPTLTSR
jgi:hypothetical protein